MQNHTGYERAWLGPWEHVRGNERCGEGDPASWATAIATRTTSARLKMGRAGWFDEVMRFYDRFLKGAKSKVKDPMIAVQTNDGKWRGEDVWPPADSKGYTSDLLPGTYTDEADGSTTDADGVWTISPPLPYDAHLSGSGHVTVDVTTTLPRANLVVDVYDLDPRRDRPADHPPSAHDPRRAATRDPAGPLVRRLEDPGRAPDRRQGRPTSTRTSGCSRRRPSRTSPSTVGTITLPFLGTERTKTIQGDPGVQLAELSVRDRDGAGGDDREFGVRLLHVASAAEGRQGQRRLVVAGPAQPPIEGSVTTKAPGVGAAARTE